MSTGFAVTYPLLWALVLLQVLLCLGLLGEIRRLRGIHLNRPLPLGSRAPRFAGIDVRSGSRVSSASVDGVPAVLLFLDSSCSSCVKLTESLNTTAFGAASRILAVCSGEHRSCRRFADVLGDGIRVLIETDTNPGELYGIYGAPAAVILDAEGRIRGYGHPQSAKELDDLFVESVGPRDERVVYGAGRQAASLL